MSYWVEIHCDATKEPKEFDEVCYSDKGNYIGLMVSNRNIPKGLKHLKDLAKKEKWIFKRKLGWVCPNCQKFV